MKTSISFEAMALWYGLKSENGASLPSCNGNDTSGMVFNLVIGIVFEPEAENRF